jgi:hypothetical protein
MRFRNITLTVSASPSNSRNGTFTARKVLPQEHFLPQKSILSKPFLAKTQFLTTFFFLITDRLVALDEQLTSFIRPDVPIFKVKTLPQLWRNVIKLRKYCQESTCPTWCLYCVPPFCTSVADGDSRFLVHQCIGKGGDTSTQPAHRPSTLAFPFKVRKIATYRD